ncbi:MAG TPA: nucleotidyltransferase [Deltaproteobacteria bacterium]|nr:nucleotidyltransferase [Deltaproteobacteria bacterium]
MMSYKIDFSALTKAVESLEDIHRQEMDVYRRDGAIQRFEYTFELMWKMMQRILKMQGIEVGSPKQVFRAALKIGLIDDLNLWFGFLEKRNLTTHTYNEDQAEDVFEASKNFLEVAKKTLIRLKQESEK